MTGLPYPPSVPPDEPFGLLADWLPAPGSGETPVMTLSTTGVDGYPDARTVLLSLFDGARVHFHTDSRSRKVVELGVAPRATVTLLQPEVARQVVVTGDVAPATPAEALAAFRNRSRYLQLLAWLNDVGTAQLGPAERRARWAAFDAAHPGPLDPPPTWRGFTVTPVRVVLWEGDEQGPSTRLAYELERGRKGRGRWTWERWAG
ncbi:pyridoxamine 5'-phosphate oxidase [Luteimicrobium xylanilyticum]|uniref:Pyridoxal 5'-phosphate synthase n=1 Tax=Luteimicrobium xylanilyticum TaxID=1133546 RepID=A0A5P9QE99_9MICO|nr:pyridoxamine 5'-phosphate oxidase family protein [Luteimicrobium xylanilyticum]QFU99576.1 Pyridoxal 5'-phosphate synthase [Luteimicrobium xylanilyticum]